MNDMEIQKLVKITGTSKETIKSDIEQSPMLKEFYMFLLSQN